MYVKRILILISIIFSVPALAQLSVAKIVGKNADKFNIGYGVFSYYDFPVGEFGNNSVRIELLDLVVFPSKNQGWDSLSGYISIKAGFRHIFSNESKTGFYIEPQIGYCRVVSAETGPADAIYGDGIAIAAEVGYTIEMGQNGNGLNFGLKYETDRAGKDKTISSIGFRISYDYRLFRRRRG